MDASRFDRLSQAIARRLSTPLSRRAALRAGGAVAAAAGSTPAVAAARQATPEATPAVPVADATPAAERLVSYLYIQVVDGGTFRPADEADHYGLELRHAGGTTLAFADRPARSVRLLPTDEALTTIGFTPDPPNAALITGPADGEVVVVVELLEGHYDTVTGTLTYRVRTLAETDRPALVGAIEERAVVVGAIEERAVVAPPASFGSASLFIDDVAPCNPPCSGDQLCYAGLCCDPRKACDAQCCDGDQEGCGGMCCHPDNCCGDTFCCAPDTVCCGESDCCPAESCCNEACCPYLSNGYQSCGPDGTCR